MSPAASNKTETLKPDKELDQKADVLAQTGEDRDRTAEDRDERAEAHDQASQARDDRAQARDERAEAREEAAEEVDPGAAADRSGALRDRQGGASDRAQAADDREAASIDRIVSSQDRTASSIDELTGAHRREEGLLELEREIARAKRTGQLFALAFVDVDHLKRTNDSLGHAAGDQLLREVIDTIRTHLRSYDLIIRFGGDEFICTLLDVTMEDALNRFAAVNKDLAENNKSITAGLTKLEPDDSLESLVARADREMYKQRKQSRKS